MDEAAMTQIRTIVGMTAELRERIKRFRFGREINTEAEAIRLLIEKGLEAEEAGAGKGKRKP